MATKNRTLRFRASEEEEATLKQRAEDLGLTLSDFIRQELALDYEPRKLSREVSEKLEKVWDSPQIEEQLYDAPDPALEEAAQQMSAETGESLTYCRAIVKQQFKE